ncbi:hypothetical protein F5Y05DRAFT_307432 [Hypoxylon sp. FL0543]|nr:hypothetical protein F5Y05DRAFT_307432 [Hypoxylon sp. FL0543]
MVFSVVSCIRHIVDDFTVVTAFLFLFCTLSIGWIAIQFFGLFETYQDQENIPGNERAFPTTRRDERRAREIRAAEKDVNKMATMLSRQWTDIYEEWARRSAHDWKRQRGASAAQVSALEQVLGYVELPRDYKAFLHLVGGIEFFWNSGHRNILFHDLSKVSWKSTAVKQHAHLLVSSTIGAAALHDFLNELRYDNTAASLPLHLLQVESSLRIFLVDPAACQKVALFWWRVLHRSDLSEEVRRRAEQYWVDHFGSVCPLQAMMVWHNWVVLEVRKLSPMETRLYPSFTHFLDEVANREEVEGTPGWVPESGVVDEARLAADDRRRWEPVLRRYASSGL